MATMAFTYMFCDKQWRCIYSFKKTSPNQEMYLWLIIDCVVFNIPLDFSSFIGSYLTIYALGAYGLGVGEY